MSLSKVYKQDASFTPTPLVQREIEEVDHQELQQEPVDVNEAASQPAHEKQPLPEPEGAPLPQESQPAEEKIDIQALQEEAYNQGVADTTAQYQRQLETVIKTFETICQKIDETRNSILERYRGDIINTVIEVSQKIINQELETSRDVVAQTIERSLEQAIPSEEFIVTIHPDDLNSVEHIKAGLMARIHGLKNLIIQTDHAITRGGCMVESKACFVDATIETQIASTKEYVEEITPPLEDGEISGPPESLEP
ncbi:MAG: hypothetical protein CSB34_04110 [Desulfobulbus propionicus]|nr:MAG: hypothetical protein CSB34_04110 [Desulfobulbus propionicus]PIE65835.1 MAG: hypothetical protein CSA26_02235 [Desulfobacterales bacterium]